jgi:hypothetical protein
MDPATLYRLYDQGPKMKYEETTGLMTDANKSMANVLNQLKLFGEKVKNRFGSKQYLELVKHLLYFLIERQLPSTVNCKN